MWGLLGKGGGRGWHRDVQDRAHSCFLHKPHHISLPQLLLQWAETCALSGVAMPSLARAFPSFPFFFFVLIGDYWVRFSLVKKTRNVVALSLSKLRFVSAEQRRHRSLTMSCLDVMYPAYGHYAPYAPTAPAFISSLQVRTERMSSVVVIVIICRKHEN